MEHRAVQHVEIDRIVCPPQVRKRVDQESQAGLTRSAAENGLLQPILLYRRGEELRLLDGARRLDSHRRMGERTIAAIIEDRELSDAEVIQRQLVANIQREDLNPVERGRAFRDLIELLKCTAAEVARRTGVSESTVSRDMAVLTLPLDVLRRVESGEIKASTAYQIGLAGNSEEQSKLAEETASGRLSRERVAEKARRSRREPRPRRSSRLARERFTVRLGSGRSLTVSGPNLTLTSLTEWLQALLKRIGTLEPQDMALADAAKALSADASCKGVVS